MTAAADESRVRLRALDGLRGLAALAVVLFHYLDRGPGLYDEIGRRFPWAVLGSYGVDLFFVISGFVIALTMQRATPTTFAISRAIRLYPVYWLCVAITFGVVAVFGLPGREVSPRDALLNLTMFQQYLGVPQVDGAYWTLSAELAFYAVCFVLLLTGAVRSRRALDVLLPVWLAVSAGTLALESVPHPLLVDVLSLAVAWSPLFIAGMVLHGAWQGDRRWNRLVLLPLAVATMTLHGLDQGLAAAVVIALVALAVWGPARILASAPLRWLGAISFALYLLHQNIGYVALRWLSPVLGQWGATLLVLVGVLALASLVTYAFDEPVRRALRRRLLPARSAEPVATPSPPAP